MQKITINKIIVIGNAAGGKTVLSRKLSQIHHLPITHVDSIQFLPGLAFRPHNESLKIIDEILLQEKWLIDGFGPLDSLEKRFELADRIVFIDLPIWRHYWWFLKRQISSFWTGPRAELPANCDELTWAQTLKIIDHIGKVHKQMRPELIRILSRSQFANKVIKVENLKSWFHLYNNGL